MSWICAYCGAENENDDRIGRNEPICRRCGEERTPPKSLKKKRDEKIKELKEEIRDINKRISPVSEEIGRLESDLCALKSQYEDLLEEREPLLEDLEKCESLKIHYEKTDKSETASQDPYQIKLPGGEDVSAKKEKMVPPALDTLYLADNKDLTARMAPESVDLIFTDPPYVSEPEVNGMPMWKWAYLRLAEIAGKVLKPSGFLITYAPQTHLDEIMDILKTGSTCGIPTNDSPRLDYYWIISSLNGGATVKEHHKNVICLHKPLLIYQKRPFMSPAQCLVDVIRGKKQKRFHPWQQSIHDVLGIISRFMEPGQTIYDPFAGTGTTLRAAKLLGLTWIGAEIDPETYAVAVREMQQKPLDLASFGTELPEIPQTGTLSGKKPVERTRKKKVDATLSTEGPEKKSARPRKSAKTKAAPAETCNDAKEIKPCLSTENGMCGTHAIPCDGIDPAKGCYISKVVESPEDLHQCLGKYQSPNQQQEPEGNPDPCRENECEDPEHCDEICKHRPDVEEKPQEKEAQINNKPRPGCAEESASTQKKSQKQGAGNEKKIEPVDPAEEPRPVKCQAENLPKSPGKCEESCCNCEAKQRCMRQVPHKGCLQEFLAFEKSIEEAKEPAPSANAEPGNPEMSSQELCARLTDCKRKSHPGWHWEVWVHDPENERTWFVEGARTEKKAKAVKKGLESEFVGVEFELWERPPVCDLGDRLHCTTKNRKGCLASTKIPYACICPVSDELQGLIPEPVIHPKDPYTTDPSRAGGPTPGTCGTCGHHKGRKTFRETCPRLGELLFKGGTKSARVLMEETQRDRCKHWITVGEWNVRQEEKIARGKAIAKEVRENREEMKRVATVKRTVKRTAKPENKPADPQEEPLKFLGEHYLKIVNENELPEVPGAVAFYKEMDGQESAPLQVYLLANDSGSNHWWSLSPAGKLRKVNGPKGTCRKTRHYAEHKFFVEWHYKTPKAGVND